MNNLRVLYYFENKDEVYIEVERLDVSGGELPENKYFWMYLNGDDIIRMSFLASGTTIEGENYRILKRNNHKILILFDNEHMKVSDRDSLFIKCKVRPELIENIYFFIKKM